MTPTFSPSRLKALKVENAVLINPMHTSIRFGFKLTSADATIRQQKLAIFINDEHRPL